VRFERIEVDLDGGLTVLVDAAFYRREQMSLHDGIKLLSLHIDVRERPVEHPVLIQKILSVGATQTHRSRDECKHEPDANLSHLHPIPNRRKALQQAPVKNRAAQAFTGSRSSPIASARV
jgi:hypothetical protein